MSAVHYPIFINNDVIQMGEYNVPYGSKNPGMAVVRSYRYLAGEQCSSEGLRLAMILGWCVEWVS